MLFRFKGWLRKEFDQKLIDQLEQYRNDWMKQKEIIEKSIEPSDEILTDLTISEAKYFYLLREARMRHAFKV